MNIASLDLRQAILHRVADSTTDDLRNTIVDAIQSGEEKTLPGLGVLFELLWEQCDNAQQKQILNAIHAGIQEKKANLKTPMQPL
ncbi:small acid-soluble spore protein SspI [Bacillaceae bacterium]